MVYGGPGCGGENWEKVRVGGLKRKRVGEWQPRERCSATSIISTHDMTFSSTHRIRCAQKVEALIEMS
jgi:hypothetical protein